MIELASSRSAVSSKCRRGWNRFGRSRSIGTERSDLALSRLTALSAPAVPSCMTLERNASISSESGPAPVHASGPSQPSGEPSSHSGTSRSPRSCASSLAMAHLLWPLTVAPACPAAYLGGPQSRLGMSCRHCRRATSADRLPISRGFIKFVIIFRQFG